MQQIKMMKIERTALLLLAAVVAIWAIATMVIRSLSHYEIVEPETYDTPIKENKQK